eukprot:16124937-Heterocapsa_arctica.AAC.1
MLLDDGIVTVVNDGLQLDEAASLLLDDGLLVVVGPQVDDAESLLLEDIGPQLEDGVVVLVEDIGIDHHGA